MSDLRQLINPGLRSLAKWSKARRDLIAVLLLTLMVISIEIQLDVGDKFFDWAQLHEDIEADELPFILLWIAIASVWFAARRIRDMRLAQKKGENELAMRKRVERQLREAQIELERQLEQQDRQIEREIAARLMAEEKIRLQQAELSHINRLSTTSEMVGALAHELNQPLFALNSYAKGCLEMLNAGTGSTKEFGGALEQILKQSRRATRNIAWIRDFVEKNEMNEVAVDLNQVVGDVRELLEAESRHFGIPLAVVMARNLPAVMIGPVQIQQVLVNLAANGLAAMSGFRTADCRLEILTFKRQDAVEIQVRDRGPGLKADMLEKVFEPFYTTKSEGLGMGLSICRSIVTTCGGELWATSDGRAGTTFHVRFPAIRGVRTDVG